MQVTHNDYLEYKKTGESRLSFATRFGLTEDQMKKLISKNKWAIKAVTRNEHAFDDYSEEAAYWAGFLASDGNVDSKNRIRLMLKYDDISHLEKFRKFLDSTYAISSNTTAYNRCSFEFTNAHIREILEFNYNIIPNKTANMQFPSHVPDKYLKHYIRGYFDGDGSICESFSNINSRRSSIYATFASGCKEFVEALYSYINNTLGTGGHLQTFKDSVKWQIKYNTNDAKTLLHYLYSDATVYLDRKYALYQKLIVDDTRLER